jgi:hypothetical protein
MSIIYEGYFGPKELEPGDINLVGLSFGLGVSSNQCGSLTNQGTSITEHSQLQALIVEGTVHISRGAITEQSDCNNFITRRLGQYCRRIGNKTTSI